MAQFQYFIGDTYDENFRPIDCYFYFRYLGSNTIKYVTLTIDFINPVGDVFRSKSFKCTGPITTNGVGAVNLERYYSICESEARQMGMKSVVKRFSAEIEFMDGTQKKIAPNDFEYGSYKIKNEWKKDRGFSTGPCYVATCVYGSYDCPEVWTLRRYRDNTLGPTWYGRLFVRTYYAISPTLVKWFGKTKWFKKLWRGRLDKMVKSLQERGVESTPYKDKEW